MPIYEYRCSSCGHELEALQKFSDAPLVACPTCRKDALVKLISAAGFQLKGSGWYVTDFRGNGNKPAAKSESAKAKDGDAGGDGKTEAKSESKSESKSETKSESASAAPAAAPAAGSGTTGS